MHQRDMDDLLVPPPEPGELQGADPVDESDVLTDLPHRTPALCDVPEQTVVHGQGVLPVTGPPTRGDLAGRLVAIDVEGPQPGVVEHAVRLLRGGEHALVSLERRLLVRHGLTLEPPTPHRGPVQRSVDDPGPEGEVVDDGPGPRLQPPPVEVPATE